MNLIPEDIFPEHKCGLYLEHNPHRDVYDTVSQYYDDKTHWISEASKAKAIATDEVWMLQWYPDTPVGFHVMASHDLSELLTFCKNLT